MTEAREPLTGPERTAGRMFRDGAALNLARLNQLSPPQVYALPLWRVLRHDCIAAGGASTGIALRERRWDSPEYWVCYCGEVAELKAESFPHRDCDGGKVIAAGGLFAYLFKEGKCSGCGLAVRSREGRLALGADLPGRGGQTPAHPGNTRQPGP